MPDPATIVLLSLVGALTALKIGKIIKNIILKGSVKSECCTVDMHQSQHVVITPTSSDRIEEPATTQQ